MPKKVADDVPAGLKIGDIVHWERAKTCIAGRVSLVWGDGIPDISVPGEANIPYTKLFHLPEDCPGTLVAGGPR